MTYKVKKIVTITIILIGVALAGTSMYLTNKDSGDQNDSMDRLIEESRERAKQEELERQRILDFYGDNYTESNLTNKDMNLSRVYDRSDVVTHARFVWGIIDDESREEAKYSLPLSTEAMQKHFSNEGDVYYGKYTQSATVDVLFAGVDYTDTDSKYSANIVADVTYYGENGESETITSNLTIHYNALTITHWNY